MRGSKRRRSLIWMPSSCVMACLSLLNTLALPCIAADCMSYLTFINVIGCHSFWAFT